MLAIVCPGQGSQTPGFLTPWLEVDGVRDQLVRLSESTGIDLVAHGESAYDLHSGSSGGSSSVLAASTATTPEGVKA